MSRERVTAPTLLRGFVVLPKRLERDFERRTSSAEATVYWSMILLMTRRLACSRPARA